VVREELGEERRGGGGLNWIFK